LVNQVPKVEQWKLSPEEKVIAGYICKKAVKTDGDQEVVAWYALEISVSAGPLLYSNLPGVILEVNVGNGQLLITTEQVALGSKYNDLIEAPTKGKKVSLQEFEDIKRAKDQEMELLRQEDMRAEEAQRSGH